MTAVKVGGGRWTWGVRAVLEADAPR